MGGRLCFDVWIFDNVFQKVLGLVFWSRSAMKECQLDCFCLLIAVVIVLFRSLILVVSFSVCWILRFNEFLSFIRASISVVKLGLKLFILTCGICLMLAFVTILLK